MRISARNSIKGVVKSVTKGPVNAEVVIDIGGGTLITSVITAHALDNLNMKIGKEVYAIIKSSEVMIAVD